MQQQCGSNDEEDELFSKDEPREDLERGSCSSSNNSHGHTTFRVRL